MVARHATRHAGVFASLAPLPGCMDCAGRDRVRPGQAHGPRPSGKSVLVTEQRRAAVPGSETVRFEQMWRSRHAIANQALMTAGKLRSFARGAASILDGSPEHGAA
jgi:hypothetical protein